MKWMRTGGTPIGNHVNPMLIHVTPQKKLVGGLEHVLFSHILGIISQLTNIFSEGLKPPTRKNLEQISCCFQRQFLKAVFGQTFPGEKGLGAFANLLVVMPSWNEGVDEG